MAGQAMNEQSSVGQRKRRNTPRRKSSRPALSPKEVGPSWLNEAAAIGVGGAGVFLAWSILEALIFGGAADHKHNLGPIGAGSARFLLDTFGWSSLVLVMYLLILSKIFWQDDFKIETIKRSSVTLISRLTGMISLAVSSSLLGAALFNGSAGGHVGSLLAQPAISSFNTYGTFILGAVAFVVSLALATGRSIQGLFSYILSGTKEIFAVTCSVGSAALVGALHGAQSLSAGFCEIVLGPKLWRRLAIIFSASKHIEEDEEEEDRPPRPKIRKNLIPLSNASSAPQKLAESESDEDEDDAEEETPSDYSHVVVMRRESPVEKVEKKKAKAVKLPPAFTDINDAFPDYETPDLALLTKGEVSSGGEDDEELRQKSRLIELKLRDFGVFGRVTQVHPGPVITLFEFEPAPGVKVGRIAALQDDLAMSLKATSIRIIAPLPKLGTVGIEVPNRNRDTVRLRDVLESPSFIGAESTLTIGLGKDTYGEPVSVDLAQMPHLLMAGSTGTGKSVCINAILMSLLYRAHPSELGLILIDPKILELSIYEDIPHLRVPVVTVPRQARAVLDWAAQEMDRRYRLMQKYGVRNIDGYNAIAKGEVAPEDKLSPLEEKAPEVVEPPPLDGEVGVEGAKGETDPPIVAEVLRPLPKIVIVIDELADLMLTVGREIEELITRLAQKARASGIHLILATQRPSVDVITGLIKANFPARLSFRVSSRIDSRTILDSMGAEKLLGRGDMLFMQPGAEAIKRIHGAFIADGEVKRVVEYIKKRAKPCYDERIMHLCQKALEEQKNEGATGEEGDNEYDEVYDRAVELVMQKGQASTSMIQRVFRIGYNRAARIIEVMERDGIIGPMDGAKPREVLVNNRDEVL